MNENLRIWDMFGPTDPSQTKGFQRSGGFKGTSIKPIWAIKRMTELFGPMGEGWGYSTKHQLIVPVPETKEIMVYLLIELWYIDPIERAEFSNPKYSVNTTTGDVTALPGPSSYPEKRFIEQWGGDKICSLVKGEPRTSDEAVKGASTDGMLKCMSYIGLGSDIHMGLFEDAKYVRDAEKTWETLNQKALTPKEQILKNWETIRMFWDRTDPTINHPATMKELVDKWTAGADNREEAYLHGQKSYMEQFKLIP